MSEMRRTRWVSAIGAALLLALAGWGLAGPLPPEGTETGLRMVDEELRELRARGFTDQDERLRLLESERRAILEAQADPGPQAGGEQPVGAPDPSLGSVPAGEVQCEAIPPFTEGADLSDARCVSVPRAAERLFAFITPRGSGLAVSFGDQGASAHRVTIPVVPDLARAALSVDGEGAIHVVVDGVEVQVIETSGW
jgi:hypothetical protein